MTLSTKINTVLLAGPPSSGKSTIGKYLQQQGNHYHVSTGNLVRALQMVSVDSSKLAYDSRNLIPDQDMFDLIKENLEDVLACQSDFFDYNTLILDGFPRTLGQIDMVDSHFNVTDVILLSCDYDVAVKRCEYRGQHTHRKEYLDREYIDYRLRDYEGYTKPLFRHYAPEIVLPIDTGTELTAKSFKPTIPTLFKGTKFGV